MAWTITILLFALWVLGLVSGATLGLWVHLLLVMAVASLILAVLGSGMTRYKARHTYRRGI